MVDMHSRGLAREQLPPDDANEDEGQGFLEEQETTALEATTATRKDSIFASPVLIPDKFSPRSSSDSSALSPPHLHRFPSLQATPHSPPAYPHHYHRRRPRRSRSDGTALPSPLAVRRRLDRHLLPLLFTLYFLAFLDRSNIGNALAASLPRSLSLTDHPQKVPFLLRAFYVTYILLEPLALLYRVLPAHVYVSACVVAWGAVACAQSLVTGFGALVGLRLLLGAAEAAFGPGVPYYLSFFYRREELAYRVGWFVSAAPLASCVAGAMAWGILKVAEGGPVEGWRLLFLVEGAPSLMVGVWCWWLVPDGPDTARFLSAKERKVAVCRLADREGKGEKRGVIWGDVKAVLLDPRSYLTAGMFFSCNVAFSSMPIFEPMLVNAMGYSSTTAQGLSALPNLSAFFVVLLVSHYSDKFRSRSPFIMLDVTCSMLGYLVLAVSPALGLPPALKYLCLFPITAGFFSAVTLIIVWTMDNQDNDSGKAAGVALLGMIGQMGPMLGTGLYPDSDRPTFARGHAVCAGFMFLTAVLAFGLRQLLKRENSVSGNGYVSVKDETEMSPLEEESDAEARCDGLEPVARFMYIL